MKKSLILFACLPIFFTAPAHAQIEADGFLRGEIVMSDGPDSWLDSGFGRLLAGGETDSEIFGSSHLEIEWPTASRLRLHVQAIAREEPNVSQREPFGITEAYVEAMTRESSQTLRLRAGMFFLPTSRENVDAGWSSPYTITFSAINSWMAEEFRPIGADVEYRRNLANGSRLSIAGTSFGGNDTLGSLMAWRGWSMHDRLTVFGEVLPLPPLFSFDGAFASQRDDGTRPFGKDLDGKLGWAGRIRWQYGDRLLLQASHIDNEGDRDFYDGEYSWATRFTVYGGELHLGSHGSLIAEVLFGRTGMGLSPLGFVQIEFDSVYVLGSWTAGSYRVSARYDSFTADDRDGTAETNDDDGSAWTGAAFWEPKPRYRMGVEIVDQQSERAAAAQSGFDGDTSGRTLRAEFRYRF